MYNRQYELIPIDGRKSFYGKAWVDISKCGTETLYSYRGGGLTVPKEGELTCTNQALQT